MCILTKNVKKKKKKKKNKTKVNIYQLVALAICFR